MSILFFDTETTGLVKNWDKPSDPANPRMVQIGCVLTDDKGRPLNVYSSIVKPSLYEIPEIVANIHGITTEYATKYGHPLKEVLAMFKSLYQQASLIVAHNHKFDNVVLNHEISRTGDHFSPKDTYCTMLSSTNVCCIPAKRGGYKWPKLSETYQFFFNDELHDAHDALTDVMACKRVFFEGLKAHEQNGAPDPLKHDIALNTFVPVLA